MIKLLTKEEPKEGYWDRLVKRGDRKTLIVKLCDRLDNLRSLKAGTVEFQKKQIQETMKQFPALLKKLSELDYADGGVAHSYLEYTIWNTVTEVNGSIK